MKKIILITALLLVTWINLQAKPVAGITSISWNTTRGMTLASLFEQHTLKILKDRSSFDTIDQGIINRELTRFNCFDERCVTPFARNAGINLIINGNIQDRDSYLIITLKAYGVNTVYNGNLIHEYSVRIPLDVPAGSREFSLISEEHSARFISGALMSFRQDIQMKRSGDLYMAETELNLNGTYPLYIKNRTGNIIKTDEVILKENRTTAGITLPADSFILINYKKEAEDIKEYYNSRKREILFHDSPIMDTFYAALLTPFASASMPVASPFLGYYMNNDWSGLGLWMVNASPYLYMEARGLYNTPSRLKESREDITRDDMAMYYFAWYMAAAGGLPLFIDSYASNYLRQASYYSGDTRFLGNSYTAAYLSLVSNGGGMFYRGHRGWGYFYFHLNNMLLYMTIRDFSRPEDYNSASDSYETKESNTGRGKKLCALLAASKLFETIHTLTSEEDLENGVIIEGYTFPEPFFTFDENNSPVYGAVFSYKF